MACSTRLVVPEAGAGNVISGKVNEGIFVQRETSL